MIKAVLDFAKRESGKKAPINFQVLANKKKVLDNLCKIHGITLTGLMNGLIDVVIQEFEGMYQEISADSLLKLHNRINQINKELSELRSALEHNKQTVSEILINDDLDEIISYKDLMEEKKRIETIFEVQGRLIDDKKSTTISKRGKNVRIDKEK